MVNFSIVSILIDFFCNFHVILLLQLWNKHKFYDSRNHSRLKLQSAIVKTRKLLAFDAVDERNNNSTTNNEFLCIIFTSSRISQCDWFVSCVSLATCDFIILYPFSQHSKLKASTKVKIAFPTRHFVYERKSEKKLREFLFHFIFIFSSRNETVASPRHCRKMFGFGSHIIYDWRLKLNLADAED